MPNDLKYNKLAYANSAYMVVSPIIIANARLPNMDIMLKIKIA